MAYLINSPLGSSADAEEEVEEAALAGGAEGVFWRRRCSMAA